MGNFSDVYDGMTENYNMLENIMGEVYSKCQIGQNLDSNELLMWLGELAIRMNTIQKDFVETYGDKFAKEWALPMLESKNDALRNSLSQSDSMSK